MTRAIRVVLLSCENGRVIDRHPNWAVGKVLGLSHRRRHGREDDALIVQGCGMDMGFDLVYELSRVLFASHCDTCGARWAFVSDTCSVCGKGKEAGGFTCTGANCPSNDHTNGDRDRTPHRHSDPGYALNHRWL